MIIEELKPVKLINNQHRMSPLVTKVSVVIPALNEEKAIEQVIESIQNNGLKKMGLEVEILVVNNGSTDRTGELARKAGAKVILEPTRGYGRAHKSGYAVAIGDIIVTMDGDMTYPAEDISKLVKLLIDEDLDFITTNRFADIEQGAMTRLNYCGNIILNFLIKLLYRVDIKDSQSGMWLFRRDLLDYVMCRSNSMAFSQEFKLEAIYHSKCRWREVPITYRNRVGQVKLCSWRHGFSNLFSLIVKRISR